MNETRFELVGGERIAQDALTQGGYVVGQSVTIKSKSYEVVDVVLPHDTFDNVQVVVVKDCEACERCGGIKGKLNPPYEDICVRQPST